MEKPRHRYHHGHLAESLLDAVDAIATQFGIEAVTLRACAKRVGVSPASAFRHYDDKRALLTAFAARAINQLADAMETARTQAQERGGDTLHAVGMAYVTFAIDKPAFFRAMWREETIYAGDPDYLAAAERLAGYLKEGFVNTLDDEDPRAFSPQELLAWSSVHGLAALFVDGPVAKERDRAQKLRLADAVLMQLGPAFSRRA
ncbi:MAG: TetR/AcrR family transcriptional regulator [Chromatiaceae bacterium]|nr:TetR/AcrR family transcriptional regulator [Gammaproteobacteria bacterium]MCP5301362.1 TetR/AcrR family transcriptional regulator [Chromatiaceae bacterium]MCP5306627.1 TetR/AcrR family transcriptional regulator [Chromatiaceae bacterium]MCP5421872.1 TetR/AcrR family transcriptional regulator [Chromatiaceae bacterium]